MGWLPWSSSSSTDTSKASDGGRIAPDRTSRERCWEGRDKFFTCLDNNNILDALKNEKEAQSKCGSELAEFEGACAKAWVCSSSSECNPIHFNPILRVSLESDTDAGTGQVLQGEARDGI